jgi:RNA polymerase sigma-70 factor, ECF subfamily
VSYCLLVRTMPAASVTNCQSIVRNQLRTRRVSGLTDIDVERAIRQYHVPFRRFAYRLVGSEADDVLQTAYLKAFSGAGSFRREGTGDCVRWLYRIIYRCAIDDLRRQKRTTGRDASIASSVASHDQSSLDEHLYLLEVLQRLSPEHRAVVLLVDQVGFSYDEASDILEIPRGTVASRLSHSRRKLREALAGHQESRHEG